MEKSEEEEVKKRSDGEEMEKEGAGRNRKWGRRKITKGVYCCVRFEAFTAVTMKNAVFWDV
jgi:hypothetical protein